MKLSRIEQRSIKTAPGGLCLGFAPGLNLWLLMQFAGTWKGLIGGICTGYLLAKIYRISQKLRKEKQPKQP